MGWIHCWGYSFYCCNISNNYRIFLIKYNMYDYGARHYYPSLGRWFMVDRFAEKYESLTPYHYAANNPIYFVDVKGDSLKPVTMVGLTSQDTELKQRTYYVDSKIADNVVGFVSKARSRFSTLSVNNTFRLGPSSSLNTKYTKAKDLSRHQGGFAIDMNGVSRLSDDDRSVLNEIAAEFGLYPLKNQGSDPPHFSANPTDYGYTDLGDAVDENKSHYESLTTKSKTKGVSTTKTTVKNKNGKQVGTAVKYSKKGSDSSSWSNFVNNFFNNIDRELDSFTNTSGY